MKKYKKIVSGFISMIFGILLLLVNLPNGEHYIFQDLFGIFLLIISLLILTE